MSDQLVVEREGLEKKDKSELQAIVSALGGAASSRARKSELIDQILELSGATARATPEADDVAPTEEQTSPSDADTDGEAGADGEAATDEADPDQAADGAGPEPEPDGEADDAGEATVGEADGPASGEETGGGRSRRSGRNRPDHPLGPDGEPLADWEIQVMEEGGGASADGKNSRRRNRGKQGDRNGKGHQDDKAREDKAKDDAANHDRSDKGGDKGDTDGGEAKGGEGDDVDPNNRRSRRRNRNRNRDRDDAGNDGVSNEPVQVEGYLDLREEGYAFLRVNGFLPSRDDAYVSVKHVRTHGLRKGDHVTGTSRPASRNEKNPALQQLETINGRPVDEVRGRPRFDRLTPLFPDERLVLERPDEVLEMTTRIIDLVCPIGKGQRGLIVSPPKAGKTSIMKQIARSIEVNNPEVELIVLLIDERPEEVTDMERHLERGEVVSSTFDRPPEEHTAVAELTMERAKRRVEDGKDVVLIVDGITRLARAYNLSAPQSGRVLSGGVDAAALYPPKRFLGAARNVEEGGSLTMLATALVETGSRMDEVIFEEFKGTGNMELRLDRRLAEKRIFPAIDVEGSSTRNEELLRDRKEVEAAWKLRKVIAGMNDDAGGATGAGIEMLVERLKSFRTNAEFLAEVAKTRA